LAALGAVSIKPGREDSERHRLDIYRPANGDPFIRCRLRATAQP